MKQEPSMEEKMIQIEKDNQDNVQFLASIRSNLFSSMNELLLAGTIASKKQLIQIFHDNTIQPVINNIAELRQVKIMMEGFEQEIKQREMWLLLNGHRDINALVEIFQSIKFYLWELEFLQKKDTKQEFLEYIQREKISKSIVEAVLHTCSFHISQIDEMITSIYAYNH